MIYPLITKQHKTLSLYDRPNFRVAKLTERLKNWLKGQRRKQILPYIWININTKY